MKFSGPLIVVDSIAESRKFYEELLGQKVILDFGENISFEGGFSLQSKASWMKFIYKGEKDIIRKNHDFEFYFEEEDFAGFMARLRSFEKIEYVHEATEYPWGQKAIRFYDLDGHIVEVGESMKSVIKRFLAEGLSVEETARISQHPIEFVQSCVE